LVWFVFKLFCCCFSRSENINLSISWLIYLFWIQQWYRMLNLAVYQEVVWTITRWRFNLGAHCCERIADSYALFCSL
jgi:hypothetical protein